MTESFGMQLDDDSLLALFSRVRPAAAVFCCMNCTNLRYMRYTRHDLQPHQSFLTALTKLCAVFVMA